MWLHRLRRHQWPFSYLHSCARMKNSKSFTDCQGNRKQPIFKEAVAIFNLKWTVIHDFFLGQFLSRWKNSDSMLWLKIFYLMLGYSWKGTKDVIISKIFISWFRLTKLHGGIVLMGKDFILQMWAPFPNFVMQCYPVIGFPFLSQQPCGSSCFLASKFSWKTKNIAHSNIIDCVDQFRSSH